MFGDTRETFIIQKKIQRFSNSESKNRIKVFISLKKNKTIKEKNIQNKVTKYNISLSAEVKIIDLNTTNEIKELLTLIKLTMLRTAIRTLLIIQKRRIMR